MHWLDQWKALAIRIDCLLRAGDYTMSAFAAAPDLLRGGDFNEVVRTSLGSEVDSISSELGRVLEAGGQEIPGEAAEAAKAYLAGGDSLAMAHANRARMKLLPLAVFRGRFEYFIRDSEVEARSLVELAFEHLRRRIAVDEPYAEQWRLAFYENEPKCERLGAVHLLSHGIWAFKVQGARAETDLVCGEPIAADLFAGSPIQDEIGMIQRTARTLVLTEWKLLHSSDELASKAAEAKAQAELYASGVLQTVELKKTRYLVLVAQEDLAPPPNVIAGGITYRHIMVPVQPGTPAQTARKPWRS